MNVLENNDKVKSFIFNDLKEAAKKVNEVTADVLSKRIKGFQFFQEQHKNRFKITNK